MDGFANNAKIKVIRDNIPERTNHLKAMQFMQSMRKQGNTINDFVLTQHSLSQGLRECGEWGRTATMKEMIQMSARKVFGEIKCKPLPREDKQNALSIPSFPAMKRDGAIKGQACANGRKQQIWMQKEHAVSPTPAVEAPFCAFLIDAVEKQCVVTCDLPGHFLQTNAEVFALLRTNGDLADILAEMDAE